MKRILLSITALLSILFMAFIPQVGYKVNDKASNFKLKNIDGKMVSLPTDKDTKGAIVIFTCNHCPFSVAYEDRIIALHNKYAAQGYPVIAINSNDPIAYPDDAYEKMQERAKEKSFPFAYVFDETQAYAKKYGAIKTPHVFILKKQKKQFVVSYIGAIDDNSDDEAAVTTKYAENALNELLADKPVSVPTTKAIGCGIKWKK